MAYAPTTERVTTDHLQDGDWIASPVSGVYWKLSNRREYPDHCPSTQQYGPVIVFDGTPHDPELLATAAQRNDVARFVHVHLQNGVWTVQGNSLADWHRVLS